MAFYELKKEFYDVWLILDQFRVDSDSKKCDLFFKLDSWLHNREPILPEQTIKRLQTLALSVTQQMASKKHPFFEYLLSFFYRGKWGCPANHQESFDFANRSSLQNNSWGFCGLGYCYDCGIGVPADQKKAVSLYKKSADMGNYQALRNYALCLQYGEGIEPDSIGAFKLLQDCVENGSLYARNNLGYCYDQGIGVTKDLTKAFSYYMDSALLGDEYSMYNVGNSYQNGFGVAVDIEKSIYWILRAKIAGKSDVDHKLRHFEGSGLSASVDHTSIQIEQQKQQNLQKLIQKQKNRKSTLLLMCSARNFDENSLFDQTFLPYDLFRLIFLEADLIHDFEFLRNSNHINRE